MRTSTKLSAASVDFKIRYFYSRSCGKYEYIHCYCCCASSFVTAFGLLLDFFLKKTDGSFFPREISYRLSRNLAALYMSLSRFVRVISVQAVLEKLELIETSKCKLDIYVSSNDVMCIWPTTPPMNRSQRERLLPPPHDESFLFSRPRAIIWRERGMEAAAYHTRLLLLSLLYLIMLLMTGSRVEQWR